MNEQSSKERKKERNATEGTPKIRTHTDGRPNNLPYQESVCHFQMWKVVCSAFAALSFTFFPLIHLHFALLCLFACCKKMVAAWFMDDKDTDQRLPHKTDPVEEVCMLACASGAAIAFMPPPHSLLTVHSLLLQVSLDTLKDLGVLYWSIPVEGHEASSRHHAKWVEASWLEAVLKRAPLCLCCLTILLSLSPRPHRSLPSSTGEDCRNLQRAQLCKPGYGWWWCFACLCTCLCFCPCTCLCHKT